MTRSSELPATPHRYTPIPPSAQVSLRRQSPVRRPKAAKGLLISLILRRSILSNLRRHRGSVFKRRAESRLSPSAVPSWFIPIRRLRDAADCVEELLKVVLEWPGYGILRDVLQGHACTAVKYVQTSSPACSYNQSQPTRQYRAILDGLRVASWPNKAAATLRGTRSTLREALRQTLQEDRI